MAQPAARAASDLPSSPPPISGACFDPDAASSPLPCPSILPAALSSRKRQLSEYDSSLSSDPLFSEDASDIDDVTRYDRPRRKRMVKGPWWVAGGSQPQRKNAQQIGETGSCKRNLDSGVFMGSDFSEESIENVPSSGQGPLQALGAETASVTHVERSVLQGEVLAQQIVNQCLESGQEVVDLSNLRLMRLAPEIIISLHQLIRQSHNHLTEPPPEDEFATLTPDLKLFLAGNNLTCLPDELFLLHNTTVLSLRNNDLAELPASIGRLHRLQELNIAGNGIRVLPWELLPLLHSIDGSNKQITVRPNPLVEPVGMSGQPPQLQFSPEIFDIPIEALYGRSIAEYYLEAMRRACVEDQPLDTRSELELRLALGRVLERQHLETSGAQPEVLDTPRDQLLYLASSQIHLFGIDGRRHQQSSAPDVAAAAAVTEAVITRKNEFYDNPSDSRTPSLFELATRSVQTNYHLDVIPESLSATIQTALGRAAKAERLGNQKCSSCQRPFVMARAQWVEYWFCGRSTQAHLTPETILPFMRFACSWGCAKPSEDGEFR